MKSKQGVSKAEVRDAKIHKAAMDLTAYFQGERWRKRHPEGDHNSQHVEEVLRALVEDSRGTK